MANETILQHPIFADFILPFLLMFFIVFAVLEKTKVLGDEKKQINALVSFVIAVIFVSAVSPKLIVNDLILFMTVGLIVLFVGILLFGFVWGGEVKLGDGKNWMKYVGVAIVMIALITAVLWTTGFWDNLIDFFFKNNWSSTFWINALFIVIIAAALAVAIKSSK